MTEFRFESLIILLIVAIFCLPFLGRMRRNKLQRESRLRQELALEGSGTAVWDYDVESDQLFLSAQWSALMGHERKSHQLSLRRLEQLKEVPGFARVASILNAHLNHAKRSVMEDCLVLDNAGHQIWFNACSRVAQFDDKDNPKLIVGTFSDITYHKGLEENLRTSQQRLQFHLDNSPLAVVEFNHEFSVTFWNQAAAKMFGYSAEQALGKRFDFIVPKSTAENMKVMCEQALSGESAKSVALVNRTSDGRAIQCKWNNTPLINVQGQVGGFASIVEDITEQRQVALRQQRSQKMEALGSLTGGIAHDYNNVLSVIIGYCEMLEQNLSEQPEPRKYVEQIYHAAERGAGLARNLLKFSKQKPKSQAVEDLNRLLRNDRDMLHQTLTVSIDLQMELQEPLWSAKVDAAGFEDMLFNLCINAKHAMEQGGKLSIISKNKHLDEEQANKLNVAAGDYVTLTVADTGCGMSENTLQRIFDPYFTTKGNKGTGLGLSQVYGFVEASGGVIDVFSQPGLGSRFVIYFPRHLYQDEVRYTFKAKKHEAPTGGDETILIVDDETALCELVSLILKKQGYRTFCAFDAEQALDILTEESVDLMLSDVIMPKTNGYVLAEKVSRLYPDTKILLASGYHEQDNIDTAGFQPQHDVLAKPYDSDELLQIIRAQLDTVNYSGRAMAESVGIDWSDSSVKIIWTDKMSIDNGGEIDKDHQQLLYLLNQCREMANGEKDFTTLPFVIEQLQNYTKYHFSREQMAMEKIQYPKYAEHCKIHNMLINKMQTIIESNNDRQIVQWLSEFLARWLIEHIMVMDKAFVAYLQKHPDIQEQLKAFEGDVF